MTLKLDISIVTIRLYDSPYRCNQHSTFLWQNCDKMILLTSKWLKYPQDNPTGLSVVRQRIFSLWFHTSVRVVKHHDSQGQQIRADTSGENDWNNWLGVRQFISVNSTVRWESAKLSPEDGRRTAEYSDTHLGIKMGKVISPKFPKVGLSHDTRQSLTGYWSLICCQTIQLIPSNFLLWFS